MTQTLPSTRPAVIAADFDDADVIVREVPGTPEERQSIHSDQVRRCRLANVWARDEDEAAF